MRIIDLTLPIPATSDGQPTVQRYFVPLSIQGDRFQAVCYHLAMNGMSGTYVDFPGHIECFENGQDAGSARIEDLVMIETTVIHLDIEPGRREVTARDLEKSGVKVKGGVLIVHALGEKDASDYDMSTIPYFGKSAIAWIISSGVRAFASDIYEKRDDQQGIFSELFKRGIWTVCCPANLHRLKETYSRSCIVPLAMPGVTQLPCRFFVIESQSAP